MRKNALSLFILFLMVWQLACNKSVETVSPSPNETDAPYVAPTQNPKNAEYAALWNPTSIDLDGNPDTFHEFLERTSVLLVVRETTDTGPVYRDMFLITQELAKVRFEQYQGRPTKLNYQYFEGKSAEEVGKIGDAVRVLLFEGSSTYQFALTIRPTEVDWHQWIVGGQNVAPNVTWRVQGRELASYIQRVQVQDWSGSSNLAEFWANNYPGYVVIKCAAPFQNETYVFIKEENRPFADQPICTPETADGYYFINNSSAVVETHGLLLQEYWEIQEMHLAGNVQYFTTWDNVLGYSTQSYVESSNQPVFPGATATSIVPYSVP